MSSIEKDIEKIAQGINAGETVLYPTDTVWGLGCAANRERAIERLYELKQRDETKSMLVLCGDMRMVDRIAVVGETVRNLLLSERPTTVIMKAREESVEYLSRRLLAADHTIGIRVPRTKFLRELLARIGSPLVSTSANLSGEATPKDYESISRKIKEGVDLIVDPAHEQSGGGTSSRIVKVQTDGTVEIIRP